MDECLNLKSNFNMVFKKFSHKIYQFGKIKKYINVDTRILVYKQTIMPLVEYVGFMLNMNNNQDTMKLQRLQNRALRMCFEVNIPFDICTADLHNQARVATLQQQRDLSLLCIMYELKQLHLYEKIGDRVTRQCDKYIFQTDVASVGVCTRSPYHIGSKLWNSLPAISQHARTRARFNYEVRCLLY